MLNAVLRSATAPDGTSRCVIFGFVLNLPPDLVQRAQGRDVHLLARVTLDGVETGTKVLVHTDAQSPEDILERGIPPFSDP